MFEDTILVVEDDLLQLNPIKEELELRNFKVATACSFDEGLERARDRPPFAVVILDMNLHGDKLAGARLGIELKKLPGWRENPPEFLINSAYGEADQYRQALEVGVASYLPKNRENSLEKMIDVVCALVLRHALRIGSEEQVKRAGDIAISSRDRPDAIITFAREILFPVLSRSLGQKLVLLVKADKRSQVFSTAPSFRGGRPEVYEYLQSLVQVFASSSEPFTFEAKRSVGVSYLELRDQQMLTLFDGGCFVPLAQVQGIRIDLGILPDDRGNLTGRLKRAHNLAKEVYAYSKPAVLQHLLCVTAAFADMEARRRETLRLTSQFCLFVAQEQLSLLDAAAEAGEVRPDSEVMGQLRWLAEDLRGSGIQLSQLAYPHSGPPLEVAAFKVAPTSLKDFVVLSLEEAAPLFDGPANDLVEISGDAKVSVEHKDYLVLAIARIFQWFAMRLETRERHQLKVWCSLTDNFPTIIFADKSKRIPARLRALLFEPLSGSGVAPRGALAKGPGLTSPLYMAKTLIETGLGGRLTDTVEGEETRGNRFTLTLPPVNERAA